MSSEMHHPSETRSFEQARKNYHAFLKAEIDASANNDDLYPMSHGSANPLIPAVNGWSETNQTALAKKLLEIYAHVLKPYLINAHPIDKTKRDYSVNPKGDRSGHKLHLNVASDNVLAVSRYLIAHGYTHKYLQGGDILEGKIFTVYVGSKNLADTIANRLSHDLGNLICSPSPHLIDEVEYAPNIAGRFDIDASGYQQYSYGGLRGAPTPTDFVEQYPWPVWQSLPPDEQKAARDFWFEIGFNRAAQDYGTYFYGSEKHS